MIQPELFKSHLRPYKCDDLVRLGHPGSDGGYIAPMECVMSSNVLISMGISDDWTFDADFLNRNSNGRVIGVDHTISGRTFVLKSIKHTLKSMLYGLLLNRGKAAKHKARAQFFGTYFTIYAAPSKHLKLRVAATDSPGTISFTSLMKLTESTAPNSVFVKCDIEGSEYEIIDQILQSSAIINGLVIEFHHLDTMTDTFNTAIRDLLTAFTIVHIHGNNFGNYIAALDFPDAVEISFINTSLFEKGLHGQPPALSNSAYPVKGLDVPNNPELADFPINFT
ncbi:MAG: FkbM family methyltransferase [Ignavibacteria bacterium]|nr:FkbM family methyltransferase [Ignavibacteria bacterium]